VPEPIDPAWLATAVEVVVHAGDVQTAQAGAGLHVEKKGIIDLVTDTDREIERDFRTLIAHRFPGHEVLGEEFSSPDDRTRIPDYCWIFDPIDGTTNFAHGLPIFCSSLALEVRGELVVAAVYDPNRRELFTAERGRGAWLNGAPMRVSQAETLIDSLRCTGFRYRGQEKPEVLGGRCAH
jgi:myo-inositol-1(or 4)-monophosphatase